MPFIFSVYFSVGIDYFLNIINTLVFVIVSKYPLTPIVSNLVGLLNKYTFRKQNGHNIHTQGSVCCYHCRSLCSL